MPIWTKQNPFALKWRNIWIVLVEITMLIDTALRYDLCHIIQPINDILERVWAIQTKFARQLDDNTEQVSGEKLPLGVKREQTPYSYSHQKHKKFQFYSIFTIITLWRHKQVTSQMQRIKAYA